MISKLYQVRFSSDEQAQKRALWKILCADYFQKYVHLEDVVLDLGAGYCEFINHIHCKTKYAVDLNEDTRVHAAPDVQVLLTRSSDLHMFTDSSVDVVFASNFFEHLPTKDEFLSTLQEVHRVLRTSAGRLLILQPNIRLLHGKYWDFVDHHIPLTDRTLVEALETVGLKPVEVRARFLPYTTKSRLPQHPFLVRLYLRLKPAQWLLGKQAWVVAMKP